MPAMNKTNPKSPIHDVRPGNPAPFALPPDRQGGVAVRGHPGEILTLTDRRMRCLDLVNCAELRFLDLSACRPGLSLTVSGCPELRRIVLPPGGEGAVIHVDAGDRAPCLDVKGAVASLDACWQDGEFALASPCEECGPFAGCRVDDSLRDGVTFLREALVVVGDREMNRFHLPPESPVRQVQLVAAAELDRVLLEGPALERMVLRDCPRLRVVDIRTPIRTLRIERARDLRRVEGDGHALTLAKGSGHVDGVALTGLWEHAAVTESHTVELNARQVARLLLRGCSDLRSLRTSDETVLSLSGQCAPAGLQVDRLNLDERAIEALLRQIAAGATEARQALLGWCDTARRPKTRLLALIALLGLARQGDDPAALWTLRCRVHLRSACPGKQKLTDDEALAHAARAWSWRLPDDLYQQGWDADLQLWLLCRHTDVAKPFRSVIPFGAGLTGAAAVARELLRQQVAGSMDSELLALLRLAVAGPRAGGRAPHLHPWWHHSPSLGAAEMDELDQLVQIAVALRDADIADALIECQSRLSLEQRINLLGGLAAFGHQAARVHLIRLASELRRPSSADAMFAIDRMAPPRRLKLQQRAGSLALAPARSDALAATPSRAKQGGDADADAR
jgi:hypothetical protein